MIDLIRRHFHRVKRTHTGILDGTVNRAKTGDAFFNAIPFTFLVPYVAEYVLIDCAPSLGMVTLNALAAADSALIPVQSHYLSTKGFSKGAMSMLRIDTFVFPPISSYHSTEGSQHYDKKL